MAKRNVTLNVDLVVECELCGGNLIVKEDTLTLGVTPCKDCKKEFEAQAVDAARDGIFEEGKQEGLLEANREQAE